MRMKVVFPLPFGPRKPKISPPRDLQVDAVDDGARAEALGDAPHVDRQLAGPAHGAEGATSTGWPGCRSAPAPASKTASIMKTSLARLSRL